jgi:alkylation response protein AidB-like acyl-CoA dehydrogenase
MDLLPSPDQEQIVDTIKGFLSAEVPVDRLREHGALGNPDAALWPQLGELGFIGLGLDEAAGGIGLSSAEEALVYREFGRHLVSIGLFGLTLGARVAAAAGNSEITDQLLTGSTHVGIGNAFADVSIGEHSCNGQFHLFEASSAPLILLLDESGAALVAAEDCTSRKTVNATDAVLTLERASLDNVKPRAWVGADEDPVHTRALLLLAAYATGLAEATRDMAVEYAKDRHQFGKPIGAFQAVKHICADMAIRTEAAQSQSLFAALVFAEQRSDQEFQVVSSKIVATDTALQNAAANIQVHGAFGFTAEANAHHYLKRAHVADQLWGDLRAQRRRLLNLPPAAE